MAGKGQGLRHVFANGSWNYCGYYHTINYFVQYKKQVMRDFLFCILFIVLGISCASVKAPEGGPKDTRRPVLLSSLPQNNSTRIKPKSVTLHFTEMVTEDNTKKLLLSPITQYTVTGNGKTLKITPDSGWIDNITYTLVLSKKIKDDREGNLLKDTTLFFSTGNSLDTNSLQLEPTEYSNKPSNRKFTALVHRAEKIVYHSTTDSLKPLIVSGLKKEKFFVEVFNDKNEDYTYDELDGPLFFDSLDVDQNIKQTVKPLPQKYKPIKIFKQRRKDTLVIESSAYIIPDGEFKERTVSSNLENTLFWIHPYDHTFLISYSDTLRTCYLDTADILKIDTTRSLNNVPLKRAFAVEKEKKQWNIRISWNWNIKTIPREIETTQDSVWVKTKFRVDKNEIVLTLDKLLPRSLKIRYDTLSLLNGKSFRKDSVEILKSDLAETGFISGTVKGKEDTPIVIELFNQKKELVARRTGNNFRIDIEPGKYYLQTFNDQDKDGHYTGGNKEARRKAEPLYFYPEPIELKPGWDIENIAIDPEF